jgi:nucleoside-diphosphate-sugar epimerase
MQAVSIVGCGYTGRRLAARWLSMGARVRGIATRAESLARIAAVGARALQLDLDPPQSATASDSAVAPALALAGHDEANGSDARNVGGELVYYMVPPAKGSDGDPRLERYLASVEGLPRRIIYLSTTGVYGDRAGAKVDEDTPPAPKTARAARRVAAEHAVREWADSRKVSWCILRVPGIYGPGRLPLDRLRRGEPAIAPQEATPGNRIHVADLVTACVAAGVAGAADRRIFNITDGSEDSLTEYLLRVAAIAALPAPPLVSRAQAARALSETSWSFLAESRRVDNRRMLEELGVALEFRDLDAGIRASLAESPD